MIVAALLVSIVPARGDNSKTGTSAFPFMKINVGARPVAMGGAFTGLADDESALYYNPAGITSFEGSRYILGYHNYFVGMQSGFLGVIRPVGYTKVLAGYISYLNYGSMKETDNFGNVTGEFGGSDMVFGVTFAYNHDDTYRFGVTGKFIYEKIHDYSATGIALDLGAKYITDRQRYTFGIMLQNLGVQLSTLGEGDKESLPITARFGSSARPRGLGVLFSADLIKPFDNDFDFAIGGEYYDLKPLYIRLGWNTFGTNYRTSDSEDSWAGLSVGFGFEIADLGFLKNTHLSYSFSPGAELGSSHRITLTGGN
jgi:hypothetical protein